MTYNIEKLMKIGANRWQKNGKDRVYLSKVGAKILGLEVSRYNSGNISSAYLHGEQISNGEACRVAEAYRNAYIDVATGELHGVCGHYEKEFIEAMEAYKA